eukprot:305306-Chlamydomonas_euryale.AAC.1
MPSLQKPKKITFRGSDGELYPFLAKPKDDLRKDYRCGVWGAGCGANACVQASLAKPKDCMRKDCRCGVRGAGRTRASNQSSSSQRTFARATGVGCEVWGVGCGENPCNQAFWPSRTRTCAET